MRALQEEYRPGQRVPTSGIYKVNHDSHHTEQHEITAVKGEPFPPCRGCSRDATYTIVRAAHHLKEDPILNAALPVYRPLTRRGGK